MRVDGRDLGKQPSHAVQGDQHPIELRRLGHALVIKSRVRFAFGILGCEQTNCMQGFGERQVKPRYLEPAVSSPAASSLRQRLTSLMQNVREQPGLPLFRLLLGLQNKDSSMSGFNQEFLRGPTSNRPSSPST